MKLEFRKTIEERYAEIDRLVKDAPVEQRDALRTDLEEQAKLQPQAEALGKQWQVTPHFALRFMQLEAEVAALKSK